METASDLSTTKANLEETKTSLATATSEFQRQTGQLSGSLSTANAKIEYNSNAIAEVKHTAEGLQSTVADHSGKISQLQQDAEQIKFSMAGQGLDLVDGLDGELIMGYSIPNTTWDGHNACLPLPTTSLNFGEVFPQDGTKFATFYNWEAGKTYTQSIIIETDAQINTSVQPQWTWITNTWSGHNPQPAEMIDLGNNCYRLIGSYTPNSDDVKGQLRILDIFNFMSFVNATTGTYLKFRSPHFFCADDNSLAQLKLTADGLTADMKDAKGNISSLQQTAQGLTTRVSNAEGNVSSLQESASKLQSDLTNAKGDISSLQQTANGLTSRVGSAEGNISQLQQTANGLTSTVSNLHAGDRNLARGIASSQDWFDFQGFNNFENYCYDLVTYSLDTLKAGDKVTFGITMKNDGVTSGTMIFMQRGDVSQWTRDGGGISSPGNVTDFVPNGTEKALTYTIPITDGMLNGNTSYTIDIRTDNVPAGGKLSFRYAFVKKGTMATDWTPAPEDVDDSISQIKQTADQIQAQVTSAKGDISSVTQTANEVKTDLSNTKNDVASVKATADSLTAQMTDANGNISQLQQTAKGLQSTVTDQSDKISQLQQDADGLSATVGGAAIDLITNLDQPFVMGFGIANTTWQDGNAYIQLPTTRMNGEVLPQSAGFQLYIPWQAGKTYMQSIIFETDAKVTDGMQWTWFTNNGHMAEDATLVKLGNNTYRLIGSHTPTASEVTNPLRVFDIWKFTDVVDVTTGTYLKFRNPRIWCPDDNSLAQLKLTADGLTAGMQDAKGNISSLQATAGGLTTRMQDAEHNVSSLQETAKELQATVGDDNTGLVSYVKAIPGQISSAITASKQAKVITSAVDVHNMTTAGYYLLKGPLTNSPVDAWAFLRVITSDSGDRIYHKIWKDNSSTVYTEEWTGEWSGWATHINSDNLKSNVITAINQSTEGVSITGSKITLDGNVNVTPGFTLSADYIKAGTLSADRISGGTLDFSSNITVKGLTANSISSGSISGQNLNINLDNGVVEFTKGNLHSTDGGFNISIDTKSFYLDMGNGSKLWIDGNGFHLQESATQHLWMNWEGLHNYTDANTNGLWINDATLKVLNSNGEGLVAQNGLLQFSTLPTWLNFGANSTLTAQAYGIIGPDKNLFGSSKNGLFVKGREGVVIGTNSYNGETFLGSLFNANSISGSGISLSDDMTKAALFFTKAPLILAGGPTWDDSNKMSVKPYISVGSDWYYSHSGADMIQGGEGTYTRGNNIIVSSRNTNIIGYDWINFKSFGRIALDAQYVHSYPTYLKTTSAGANVFVAPDGALVRSASARKYKTDIQDANNAYGEKLIEFAPKKWIDKVEKKRYEEDPENNKKPGYYYGLIADDLDAAGLDMLVNYGADGEVEGINYDRLAVALLPVIKSLKDQVASLKKQLKALTK